MDALRELAAAAPDAHWRIGWILILGGFLSGASLGLGFHREAFLGGYPSFRRRLLRLGHIAFVALGMLNLLVAAGPAAARGAWSSPLLILGSVAMPLVCLGTAWRPALRAAFPVPVLLLVGAASSIVAGGAS